MLGLKLICFSKNDDIPIYTSSLERLVNTPFLSVMN